jgi:hypothetical protein
MLRRTQRKAGPGRTFGLEAAKPSCEFSAVMSVDSPSLVTCPLQAIPRRWTGRGVICSGI